MMQERSRAEYEYLRENGAKIVAYGILMGWVKLPKAGRISSGVGQTPEQALAARLKIQRECMCALREKQKQETERKGKRNDRGS